MYSSASTYVGKRSSSISNPILIAVLCVVPSDVFFGSVMVKMRTLSNFIRQVLIWLKFIVQYLLDYVNDKKVWF